MTNVPEMPYPLASRTKRVLSFLIDLVLVVVGVQAAVWVTALFTAGASLFAELGIPLVLGMYNWFLVDTREHATLGMRCFNLKVLTLAGKSPSDERAAIRGAVSALSLYLFCLGYLPMFFTRRRQTLHDMVSGTVVVQASKPASEVY